MTRRQLVGPEGDEVPLTSGEFDLLSVFAHNPHKVLDRVSPSYFSRVLRLSFLAPDIVKAILDGRHPPQLTAKHLMRHNALARGWPAQAAQLGIA